MTPGLLPGRGRAFLVVGMVDRDGGIDIDMQPLTRRRRRPASPRRRTGVRAGGSDTGQVCCVDAGIDQPPHRGRGRRGAKGVFPIPAPLPDAVDAVRPGGHRRGQIGEHRTRLIHPRTSIRVGQRGGDLRRQAGQIRHLPHHAHPGMRHDTMTVRGHVHPSNRCDILHLRSASRQHYRTLSSPITPCRTGTFAYINPPATELHEKSRLTRGPAGNFRLPDSPHRLTPRPDEVTAHHAVRIHRPTMITPSKPTEQNHTGTPAGVTRNNAVAPRHQAVRNAWIFTCGSSSISGPDAAIRTSRGPGSSTGISASSTGIGTIRPPETRLDPLVRHVLVTGRAPPDDPSVPRIAPIPMLVLR